MSYISFACGLFGGLTVLTLGSIWASSGLWAVGAFGNNYTQSVTGKKGFLYSVFGLGITGATSFGLWQAAGPDHAGIIIITLSVPAIAFVTAVAFWLAPKSAVAYGSWWTPVEDRAAYRQDLRFALACVPVWRRGGHAWRMIKSGPRAGLRARRFGAWCAGATATGGHSSRRTIH
ncbi:hypothetical protein PV396_43995 [Streptomyces sp. ME02-8801-2C]|uniref:hypothetical protein n=1 Tax=Streptomyces sp. ME02-8801-2C TaxID=3028680 RepID=UPI0029AEA8D2|nr:hypothetical protein [Streptomyces sp. ME02-8801-2C]MDX3458808.1 hypothetical protein [Streptomyces sp. ME02-8801-2C]